MRRLQDAGDQASGRHLGAGARNAGCGPRRSRDGVAQDGRPHRGHGRSLPGGDQPVVHGNLLRQVESIKNQGIFSLPISGDLTQPSACTRDIAATAAQLLLDRSWSGVGSVPVLGPEDLSYNDMATIMAEVLGKPVRFQEIAAEAFKARLLQRGMSEAMAQANLDMWVAYGKGLDTAEPRTPQSTTPTSFRRWCEDVLKPCVIA